MTKALIARKGFYASGAGVSGNMRGRRGRYDLYNGFTGFDSD